MAQEHQEYIQTKVNPILENLVTQVLLERPDNPVPFMVKWLATQSPQAKEYFAGAGVGEAEKLKTEVIKLQEEVRELQQKLGKKPAEQEEKEETEAKEEKEETKARGAEAEDIVEEEEEEDDAADDAAPPGAYLQKGQRVSVSAEAYGDWNKVKAFTPPVHEKTEEQTARILKVLSQSFLFNALETDSLNILVLAMVEKLAKSGERLITEGADGEVMYVIEKGVVDCKKMLSGEEKVVKTCREGDFFGELTLLYNCPRAASVDAQEDVTLWQLDRETFNHIVRDASMRKRQQHEDFLKDVVILKNLGDYERSQLADALQKQTVQKGEHVITQGEEGSKFYLVEEGELAAMKSTEGDPEREVKSYKMGDYFGELALINEVTRQASVVARTDVKLLWIDRRGFTSLLGDLQADMETLAAQYAP
eukprot:CAMPEP_0183438986 /NCGR_PEP_ID=MMETSP0370-20130417/77726_1 /TAXON_ID=268820 /ORGANISM="Peridinium aciculiferum, Strain PAER-2" /LENGTH=420 /DNA_ID=CAMNT_0025627331 /DNA_START=55 /DNA_END=1317 /DNA_ORIENTATION=+